MIDPQPPDDSTEPDPVDAELIAYLDGELEASDARRIEDQLDRDPKLRARADALKRSFDLLDFLPKPEPSSNFATRTMDKLPVSVKPVAGTAATATTPIPVAIPSSMSSLAFPHASLPPSAPAWVWALGLFLAVGFALGAGYLGTAAARKYVFGSATVKEPDTDSLTIADVRIIENLPLYAPVDDLDFLNQLAAPEFFGDELGTPETPAKSPELDKPSDGQLKELAKQFRELPAERQERIRTLDQQIHMQEPARHDRSFRLLETYAAWLQRLAEADRKEVLAAPSSAKRLDAIREVHRKQWVAALPASQRQKLGNLSLSEKADLIAKWRLEEEKSRAEWSLARVHLESLRTGRQPWPFTDERMKKDVLAFAEAAYRPDDLKRNRLTSAGLEGGDLARYREALDRTGKGEWVYLGKIVFDFSRKYETLPEPGKGNPVTDFADLSTWPAAVKFLENKKNLKAKLEPVAGRWPEFALLFHGEMNNVKLLANFPSFHLGPCRPDDFKEDVKRFLPELRKKLTEAETLTLKGLEGRWPDYPRELIRLAKAHDLSVPGAMPPGLPSLWEKTYSRSMRPGGG